MKPFGLLHLSWHFLYVLFPFTVLLLAGKRKLIVKRGETSGQLFGSQDAALRVCSPTVLQTWFGRLSFSPHSLKTGLKRAQFLSEEFQYKKISWAGNQLSEMTWIQNEKEDYPYLVPQKILRP